MQTLIEKINYRETNMIYDEFIRYRILCDIVIASDFEALDLYLSKGFELNPRNRSLRTPAFKLGLSTFEFAQMIIKEGMDPFVIDIEGNTILHEVICTENKELIVYLLKTGLNPYHLNNKLEDSYYKLVFNFGIPQSILTDNTVYKDYISYDDALSNKNFSLALSILERDVARMGGFSSLFKRLDSWGVQNLIKRIYQAFVLNKRYHSASILMNAFVDATSKMDLKITNDFPFMTEAALLMGNKASILKLLKANIKSTSGLALSFSYVHTYVLSILLDLEDQSFLDQVNEKLENEVEQNTHYAYSFVRTLKSYGDVEFSMRLKNLENNALDVTKNIGLRIKYFSLVGLIYLVKDDLVNSEYMFKSLINCIEERGRFEFHEYEQAYAMIDYINRKKK